MYNVTKFPVVVLTAPACGAQEFSQSLSAQNNLALFYEPQTVDWLYANFKNVVNFTDQFLLVCNANAFNYYKESLNRFPSPYFISLRRRDVIEQIAINYLYRKSGLIDSDNNIEIKLPEIIKNITIVNSYNYSITNFAKPYDLDLYIEDLNLNIVLAYPSNFHALKEKISNVMGRYFQNHIGGSKSFQDM